MRKTLLVLASLVLATPALAKPHDVLGTKGNYAGGSIGGIVACAPACVLDFEVRAGERYLHLVGSATQGDVTVDVTTAAGTVRICQSTKVVGPLPIEGLKTVRVVAVLDSTVCGRGPAPTGTVLAIFSTSSLSLEDAMDTMRPDPSRKVFGGI